MTDHAGYYDIQHPVRVIPDGITVEFEDYLPDYPPSWHKTSGVVNNTSENRVARLGRGQRENVLSYPAKSYKNDYYYRVHIIPQKINVGILTDEKTYNIELWNAWFNDKTLNSVSHEGVDGVEIISPFATPLLYKSLQSQIYNYTLKRQGPVNINVVSIYNFGDEFPELSIIGFRAQLFPFQPVWRRLIDRFEWKTNVLRAYSGKEQRIKGRDLPRRHYEYDLIVTDKEKRELEALLWGWQKKILAIPVWQDTGLITSETIQGGTSVFVDTENLSYDDDGRAVLSFNDEYEVVEIETVNLNSLTLKSPILNSWPSNTKIIPVFIGRLSNAINLNRYTGDVNYGVVQFTGEKSQSVLELTGEIVYRDIPVLEKITDWSRDPQITWATPISEIDYGGVIKIDETTGNNESIYTVSMTAINRDEAKWLHQFFFTRQGKLKPLWFPSGVNDLVLTNPIGSTHVNLLIENIGYVSGYGLSINKRDLRIELYDGTVFYRRVTNVISVDDQTEQLVIDSSFGISIAIEDVLQMSFMSLCRLNSDNVDFSWFKHDVMSVNFDLRTINHDL